MSTLGVTHRRNFPPTSFSRLGPKTHSAGFDALATLSPFLSYHTFSANNTPGQVQPYRKILGNYSSSSYDSSLLIRELGGGGGVSLEMLFCRPRR